ncbi:MAG: type IV secretory system conjugative DNA transfer family protein [Lachnospiraceae bacterium]|nr:type IV secretory system conjugative DNA transfer family protein [Lachnospiraceae bacterium]
MAKRKESNQKRFDRYGRRCLGKGIYVSNDTRETGINNNDLVIGGSGSSKTGSVVDPQLKTLCDSSLIVADTKNILYRKFRGELERRGYRVRVLDFVNPENSCRYNPVDYVRNELDIIKISHALIPDMVTHDPFWEISARAVLEFFIAYALSALPEEDHHMYAVERLYRAFTKERGEAAFITWLEAHPESLAAKRYDQIKAMRVAEKMWASILGFVNTVFYAFDVSEMSHIFDPNQQGEEIDIASLGREKTVVFLNISDTDKSLDKVVNLFYTQALQTLVAEADSQEDGRLRVPCRIMFDDFAAGAKIPGFDKIISVIRSRDIWTTICIQSISQLESLYSPAEARTIINNCDHIIYLGGNDIASAEFIGTRAGKVADDILAMKRTREYYIEGGMKARLVDKIPPYSYSEEEEEATYL